MMTASRPIARLWLALALCGSSACLSTQDESLGELAVTAPLRPDAGAAQARDAGATRDDAQVNEIAAPPPITPDLDAAVVEHDADHDAGLDASHDAGDAAGDAARDAARGDACREPWKPWECR